MDHSVESGTCGERLVHVLLVELVRLMDKGLLARDRSIEGGLSGKLGLAWELCHGPAVGWKWSSNGARVNEWWHLARNVMRWSELLLLLLHLLMGQQWWSMVREPVAVVVVSAHFGRTMCGMEVG